MDGCCSLVHPAGDPRPQERWCPVQPYRYSYYPPLHRGLHDHLQDLHPRLQACSARLRDHSLSLGLRFIKSSIIIPTNTITAIEI